MPDPSPENKWDYQRALRGTAQSYVPKPKCQDGRAHEDVHASTPVAPPTNWAARSIAVQSDWTRKILALRRRHEVAESQGLLIATPLAAAGQPGAARRVDPLATTGQVTKKATAQTAAAA